MIHLSPITTLSHLFKPSPLKTVARDATRRATTLAGDQLILSQGATSAMRRITEEAISPSRARDLVQMRDPAVFFDRLKDLSADQLREVARHEPKIVDKFGALTRSHQSKWLRDVNAILSTFGLEASGPVKSWEAALNKLDKRTADKARLGGGSVKLGELNDLTRARINTAKLNTETYGDILRALEKGLKERHPDRQFEFKVRDFTRPEVMADATALYKGRINVDIVDMTGGSKQWSFNLQLGPQQLTEFWERPFAVQGFQREFNIHDAVYKGVARLEDDALFAKIGAHFDPNLAGPQSADIGRALVAQTLDEYRTQLARTVQAAEKGVVVPAASTARLRTRLSVIIQALQGDARAPFGLKG